MVGILLVMRRCFIGMRVDDEARVHLLEAQAGLERLSLAAARKLKPVPGENFHATIKFLGATTDADLQELTVALAAITSTTSPEEVVLAGYDAFPSRERPRAVFAAIDRGREFMVDLAARTEAAAVALRFAPEDKPRVPHVTVARVDHAQPKGPLSDWLARAPRERLGRIDSRTLILFESVRRPEGSRYTPLAEFRLAG